MANNLGTAEFPFDQHRLYLAQGGGTFTESIVAPSGVFPEYPVYLNCDPRASHAEVIAEALGVLEYGAKAIGKFIWSGSHNTYFLNFNRNVLAPSNAGWNTEDTYYDGIAAPHSGIEETLYAPPCAPAKYCCGVTPHFGSYFDDGISPDGQHPGSGGILGIFTDSFNYLSTYNYAACAIRLDCASVNISMETPPSCTRWYATYTPIGLCNTTANDIVGCTDNPSCAAVNCCPGIYINVHILHEDGLTYTPCNYVYNATPPEDPAGWELDTDPIEIESWSGDDPHSGAYVHNELYGASNTFLLPETGVQVNLTGACKCADTIFTTTSDIPYGLSYPEWIDAFSNVHVNVTEYFHGYVAPPCTIKPTNFTLRLEINHE